MAKNFNDLSEAEIVTLAISNEETDARIYADFAAGSGSKSLKGGNRIHLFSSIAKSDARAVAIGGGARYGRGV